MPYLKPVLLTILVAGCAFYAEGFPDPELPTSTPQYEKTLSEEDRQFASSTLSEPQNDEERKNVVHEIQEWMDKNSDFKGRCDEKVITRFLRSCEYQTKCTQVKLTNHFELRHQEGGWFKNRDPEDPNNLKLLKTGTFLPLRGRDKEGRTVILIRTAAYDPSQNTFLDVFKVGHMIMDLLMELDETVSVYGVQAVLDLSGNTVSHVRQLTANTVGKAVHAWQNCYPVRTERIDFFNSPIAVNFVIKLFLKFMNEEFKNKVHVFGSNRADLLNAVDVSLLPTEYGGTAGTTQELTDYWINRLREHRQWFLAEEEHAGSSSKQ